MHQTIKKYRIIQGYLNNTIDKLKGAIRRNDPIPSGSEIFHWFEKQCPFSINKDKEPQWHYDDKSHFYEALFCFDDLRFYLGLSFEHTKFRLRKYIDFQEHIYDIDELDPIEYYDEQIIDWLKENSNLEFDFKPSLYA